MEIGYKVENCKLVAYTEAEPNKSFFDQVLEAKPAPNVRDYKEPAKAIRDVTIDEIDKALKALMEKTKIVSNNPQPKPRVKRLCGFCLDPRCKFSEQ